MTKKGKELEFISHIKRDGSGTTPVEKNPEFLNEEKFDINCLSISNGTYIAHGFNSYVVKFREQASDALTIEFDNVGAVERTTAQIDEMLERVRVIVKEYGFNQILTK